MSERTWSNAKRILCVRLDNLGDVLMSTPAIRALRHSGQERRVTLLTSPAGAQIATLVPEIDDVIVYDAPWINSTAPRANSSPDRAMADRLRQQDFDAAVIFTVYSQNPLPAALLCHLADIPLRLAHCHENPYQLLSDWIPDPEPAQHIRHEVRRQLDLVATVGAVADDETMSLKVPAQARQHVRQLLTARGINLERPWTVIHAGASAPSRRYSPQQFASAARQLVLNHNVPVVFTGTNGEAALVEQIRTAMDAPSTSLVAQLSVAELAALLELAPVAISNNSGPAHITAAVGTPVVDLYALTNPQHTPWGVASRVLYHDVPCKFCYKSVCPEGHHHCLKLVSPETVVSAALSLLDEAAPFVETTAVLEGVR